MVLKKVWYLRMSKKMMIKIHCIYNIDIDNVNVM